MTTPKTMQRAPRGTGSIVHRAGKCYAAWSTKDPATGARRQHREGPFVDARAARKFLTKTMGQVDGGTFVPVPRAVTVSELPERWLASKTEVRGTTFAAYRVAVEKWLVPHIGGTRVAALTAAHVRQLLSDLGERGGRRGRPLSARSVSLSLVTLKQAMNWGVSEGLAARNVATGLKVKRMRPEMKAWTAPQARSFLVSAADDRLHALFALALARGPRRGELCGLKWHNLDLAAGTMTIVETIVLVDGRPVASTPKTIAGVRSVPLDVALVRVLQAHKARQSADRLRAGSAWLDTGYVFTSETGEALHPDHVSGRFEKLCTAAGVPIIPLHGARHTAATLLLQARVPVHVVSQILGHGDVTITLSTYAHVLPGMADSAGETLSALVL
jgi:integrase